MLRTFVRMVDGIRSCGRLFRVRSRSTGPGSFGGVLVSCFEHSDGAFEDFDVAAFGLELLP